VCEYRADLSPLGASAESLSAYKNAKLLTLQKNYSFFVAATETLCSWKEQLREGEDDNCLTLQNGDLHTHNLSLIAECLPLYRY